MKQNHFFSYFFLIICIAVIYNTIGCTSKKLNQINWNGKEYHLTGEVVHTNEPFIRGLSLPVIIENYVINKLWRFELNYSLSILRNDSLIYIGDFLSKGRGPAEMMIPTLDYITSYQQIVISDHDNGEDKVIYIDASNIYNIFNIQTWEQKNIRHINGFVRIYPLPDYTFLGLLPYRNATHQMFYHIDTNGVNGLNILMPDDNSGITDPRVKRNAYRGSLKKHPCNSRFVYFSERNRFMHIFDFISDSLVSINTPYTDFPRYFVREGRNISSNTNDYLGTIAIDVTDKYIYILMNDATYYHLREDKLINGHPWNESNTIYVFDWDGIPIKKYILDHYVESFFIDSKEQYIYGNADAENGIEILRYKIIP